MQEMRDKEAVGHTENSTMRKLVSAISNSINQQRLQKFNQSTKTDTMDKNT